MVSRMFLVDIDLEIDTCFIQCQDFKPILNCLTTFLRRSIYLKKKVADSHNCACQSRGE